MRKLGLGLFLALCFAPSMATAFCGFYVAGGDSKLFNDATQVVLMRHEEQTVLSMQNNYQGPVADFAMVVPVPEILKKEDVKTLEKAAFDRIDRLTAPRLVEYWERDPCQQNIGYGDGFGFGSGGLGLRGVGRGGGGKVATGGYVEVKANFVVGEYDISILETNDAATLDGWLRDNKYNIPKGAEPYFQPYIQQGQYFFVAKVIAKKAKFVDGKAVLSPLRFHYKSKKFQLPIRLGMINSNGKQDLVVYTLAQNQRYEVANYPNVFIPTNLEVSPKVKHQFGNFYEALFSRTVEENPKAVVTEYSWAATKCDPCPTGAIWSATLQAQHFQAFGADVLKLTGWNAQNQWVVTRLHARYAPDDIGEDLVFKKADAIVGGREQLAKGIKPEDGHIIEKGTESASINQFQGRYIVRNEWEGPVECDEPKHGVWGPPPNANAMLTTAETVKHEIRRQHFMATEGREPTDKELESPPTPEEQAAIGFHLRRKFGTSQAPGLASGSPVAASKNTRGADATFANVALATLVTKDIPELKIVAKPASKTVERTVNTRPKDNPTANNTEPAAQAPKAKPTSCSTSNAASGFSLWLLFVGFFVARARRINRR